MVPGTRKKERDLSVVLWSICALKSIAAASEDGHWEDLPILHTNRDLFSALYGTFLSKKRHYACKLGAQVHF